MNRRQVLAAGVAAAVAAATPLVVEADNGREQDLVGTWLGTATALNPPLGQANNFISFHSGGVVTESRRYLVRNTPIGNLLETSGHGAWIRRRDNSYEALVRFFLQDADTGAAIGTDNVRVSVALDRQGKKLTGTFASQLKDTEDNVLLQVTGDYTAVRVVV